MTRTVANEAPPPLSCWKSFLNASQHIPDTCNTHRHLNTSQHIPDTCNTHRHLNASQHIPDTCNTHRHLNASQHIPDTCNTHRHLNASQHIPDTCNTHRHLNASPEPVSHLLGGVVHQRNEHDDDVVVEVEVRKSEQQLTQAADGDFGQAAVRLEAHCLTALLLLLLPVCRRRGDTLT